VKIGVTVPNYGPSATVESLRAWAALIEDAGFDFRHPDQIRADLDELRTLGATHVLLDPHPDAAARDDAARDRAVVEEAAGWLLA
jgi:hypothetical protein